MKKILIGFVIILVWGLSFHTGCKIFAQYDLEGMWVITREIGGVEDNITLSFSGDRQLGIVTWDSWQVGGYEFRFNDELYWNVAYPPNTFPEGSVSEFYTGGFEDRDTMGGTVDRYVNQERAQGTWTAVRLEESLY
jgi:hypothetical protein